MNATFFDYLGWVSLSPNLRESFNRTLRDAGKRRHQQIEIAHLLHAMIDDPEGAIALARMGVDRDELREDMEARIDDIPKGRRIEIDEIEPSRELKKLMAMASELAEGENDDEIDGGDVIRALARQESAGGRGRLLPAPDRERGAGRKGKAPSRSPNDDEAGERETASNASGESKVPKSVPPEPRRKVDFDVDPIRASIESIMARRRDAEEILYECEWYHLFKSLNMIDDALEGEEKRHRARLLARAEQELAERPRCRKAFLYVRHLDQELARLKSIVDINWAGDLSPDQAVSELYRLRNLPREENEVEQRHGEDDIGAHLVDVKIQESEILALEQKLKRIDRSSIRSRNRIRELEDHIEHHGSHSKQREHVISELESYLNQEMRQAEKREARIIELERELALTRSMTDNHKDKTSNLELELAAVKKHAGDREIHILDLETKLKLERDSAAAHEIQMREMRDRLELEKKRAESHDRQIDELNRKLEEEKERARAHEEQVRTLEADLKTRLDLLKTREEQIKILQENLEARDEYVKTREEKLKQLEEELAKKSRSEERLRLLEEELASKNESEEKLRQLEMELASKSESEDRVRQLEMELAEKEEIERQRQQEIERLSSILDEHKNANESHQQHIAMTMEEREREKREHERQVKAMRAQILALETKIKEQKEEYARDILIFMQEVEKANQQIRESERLVDIIRDEGSGYSVNSHPTSHKDGIQHVMRRTIPRARPRGK
jgi:myosin heavy subunit